MGFGLTAPQEVMSSTRRFLCIIALPRSWASEGPLNWVMLLIKPFNEQHIGDRSGIITTDVTDAVMCNIYIYIFVVINENAFHLIHIYIYIYIYIYIQID